MRSIVCVRCLLGVGVFFFIKQKTAYEMRISDWSSDVCSSDLASVAGTMIAQAAQAMEFGATSEDIAYTYHAHPTHSEAIKEAAMAVTGKAIQDRKRVV